IVFGIPMYRFAKKHGWISPAQFIEARYKSKTLSNIYAVVILLITIPYVAIQARSGGMLIQSVSGLPYEASVALIVLVVTLYVLRGGMKSVVYTDVLQLLVFLSLSAVGFFIIYMASRKAGLQTALQALQNRSGNNNSFPFTSYVSMILLWFLADPMFPQLFQRFFSARDERALIKTAALYPLVTGVLFFMTIGVGVFGSLLVPNLSSAESDQIFMKAAAAVGGKWLPPLLSIAGLAALLSTMDSQLLSVSTICVEAFVPGDLKNLRSERFVVFAIALLGYLGALFPVKTILDFLSSTAFPAYAAVAPIFFIGLFSPRIGKRSAFFALITGLGLVVMQFLGWKPGAVPTVVFNLAVQLGLLWGGALLWDRHRLAASFVVPFTSLMSSRQVLVFLGILILSFDIWNYGRNPVLLLGIPGFVWYSLFLCVLLSIAIIVQFKKIKG
ncbi:MAG: sodium:solute symporter family protein, partial [Treponema sp.]|nr:sodium:solute symporter family protein [Treponema sp.]